MSDTLLATAHHALPKTDFRPLQMAQLALKMESRLRA